MNRNSAQHSDPPRTGTLLNKTVSSHMVSRRVLKDRVPAHLRRFKAGRAPGVRNDHGGSGKIRGRTCQRISLTTAIIRSVILRQA